MRPFALVDRLADDLNQLFVETRGPIGVAVPVDIQRIEPSGGEALNQAVNGLALPAHLPVGFASTEAAEAR